MLHPFCCWLLPIWPKLDFWAEHGAYGLCRLGWQCNRAKMSFSWPYMIVSMIWNTAELYVSHLSRATAIVLLIAANLAPAGFLGWKWSLWPVLVWLVLQRSKAVFFLTLYDSINEMKHSRNCLHYTSTLPQTIFVVDGCQFGPSWMFIISMIWNTSELSTSHQILPCSVFTHIKKAVWDTISNTPNVYLLLNIFEWYSNIMMTIMNEYLYIKYF